MYINVGQETTKRETKIDRKPSNTAFSIKLEKEEFDSFTANDIVEYFDLVYREINGYSKEYSKINAISLVDELFADGFEPRELVENIDFVLRSDQTYLDKEKFGLGSFKIDRYIEYINDNIEKYFNGQPISKPKKADTSNINRKREWAGRTEGVSFSLPKF